MMSWRKSGSGNKKMPPKSKSNLYKIVRIDDPAELAELDGGGGDGGSYDDRLRAVEGDVREIKATMNSLATREDISKMENKVLSRLLWMTITVLGAALAVIGRAAFSST